MAEKETVLVLEARYDAELLRQRMREVLDAFPLELGEKSVLVKPNMLGPWPGESGIVTHPVFVRALVDELKQRGARVQVGDNPGVRGYGRVGKVLKSTGLEDLLGDDLVNITASPRRVAMRSRFVEETTISAQVLDCDVLISVPKFKTHVGTIITGAVKNSFGFLVGGEKARMHAVAPRFRDFGELMVDIYQLRVPDLVVMDAITVMEGNGPSCEDIREEGKMLASRNGVALDAVMASMMGIDPDKIPLLVTAGERGLGPVRLEDIEVRGRADRIKGFKQPSTVPRKAWAYSIQGLVFKLVSRRALRADPERCTACRTCEKSCPAGAIEVIKTPRFDHDKCINCYCCYELCPEHAIILNRFIRFIQR